MTRGEEIRNAIDTIIPILPSEKGRTYEQSLMATGFEAGAGWADEHPINVWHDVSEEPNGPYIVLCDGLDNLQWVENYQHIDMSYANWKIMQMLLTLIDGHTSAIYCRKEVNYERN